MKSALLLLVLLLGMSAHARPLPPAQEAEYQASLAKIASLPLLPKKEIRKYYPIFDEANKNCKNGSDEYGRWCPLTECDFSPKNCRKDRVVLFRGEPGFYSEAASSQMLRGIHAGAGFGKTGIRKELAKYVQYSSKDEDSFSTQLFLRHSQTEGEFSWTDPSDQKEYFLDPLVSFSIDPGVASGFGRGVGRIIAISVPRNEVRSVCNRTLPKPGDITGTAPCGGYDSLSANSEELEYDSFLYVRPQYIWKVFDARNEE